jgi:hypothetical protein
MAAVYEIPRSRRRSRIATAARRFIGGLDGLHHCVVCGSTCISPIEWEPDGADHWRMQLRCAECDVWRDVRVTNAEAKAFDLVLNQQIAAIERVLLQIDRERMREEADAFVVALQRDLIVPADFAQG